MRFAKKIKRRLLPALLAVVIAAVSLPVTASAADRVFYDVRKSDWFAGYVYALAQKGIVSGVTETSFQPRTAITRASFLVMLAASVHTPAELDAYKDGSQFEDVKSGQWYAKYANWAADKGITAGVNGKFRPNASITREEAAVFVVKFAEAYPDKITLSQDKEPTAFQDADKISSWAVDAVTACQRAGVITGDDKGNFNPKGRTDRASAATILCALLKCAPLDKSQIPEPPYREPVRFSKSVAGVGVTGVELNPTFGFTTKVGLAGNKLFTTGSASSIVTANNGYVAVDGIFFASYGGSYANEIWGTMINQGEILRIYNTQAPQKPTFVVDKDGKASIQFMSVDVDVSMTKNGKTYTIPKVGCNITVANNDNTRMIYTSKFGSKVSGPVARALAVDNNGVVTKVYKNTSNVPIPSSGYLIMERLTRQWTDEIFNLGAVGDKLERKVTYTGSTTQNISTALSCGPTVVKNGKAYGNASTYAQEGFTDAHVTVGSAARMAIGVKADGTVVIASCSCSLGQLGQVMAGLGCQTAMNLDGGASTALYYNGSWLASPGRALTNMLIFSKR